MLSDRDIRHFIIIQGKTYYLFLEEIRKSLTSKIEQDQKNLNERQSRQQQQGRKMRGATGCEGVWLTVGR